jgi:hypothetical protein
MEFLKSLKHLASPVFDVKIESMGPLSDFLDLTIYRPPNFYQTGRLAYKPFFKPDDLLRDSTCLQQVLIPLACTLHGH